MLDDVPRAVVEGKELVADKLDDETGKQAGILASRMSESMTTGFNTTAAGSRFGGAAAAATACSWDQRLFAVARSKGNAFKIYACDRASSS